jgi:hypothetical protein
MLVMARARGAEWGRTALFLGCWFCDRLGRGLCRLYVLHRLQRTGLQEALGLA